MEATRGKKTGRENSAIYQNQLVTLEHLEMLKEELLNRIRNMLDGTSGLNAKKWLKSIDVRKLLGISPGTLQNLRVNGTIPFTKIGGVLYYDHEDIQRVLSPNRKHNQLPSQS